MYPHCFRFGLRTMFVVTTFVAVLFAAYRVHPLLTAVGIELIAIYAFLLLAAHALSDL